MTMALPAQLTADLTPIKVIRPDLDKAWPCWTAALITLTRYSGVLRPDSDKVGEYWTAALTT